MVISREAANPAGEMQYPCMIQTLGERRLKGNCLRLAEGVCGKPAAGIIPKGKALKVSSLRSGTTHVCPLPPLLSTPVQARELGKKKKTKGIQVRKEEVRLFADAVFLRIENLKEPTVNCELMDEFRELQGSRVGIQESTMLLDPSNGQFRIKLRTQFQLQ